jgi:hypothetical protein
MTGYEIIGMVGILVLLANFLYLLWRIAKDASRS